ncbi:MAG: DNA internalization-related competence protein ComEC/Rec2 [Gammaproteobacteria bacterium]
MLARMLAFMFGLYAVQQLSTLPSLATLILIPLTFLLARQYKLFNVPVFLVLGAGWMVLSGHLMLKDSLPVALEQRDILVQGKVISMPEVFERYQRFRFRITHISLPGAQLPPFVDIPGQLDTRLNWYNSSVEVMPGQTWQMVVRLKRPHGFMNPGGFDYEAWLLRKGIRALGYVRSNDEPTLLQPAQDAYVERLRFYLAQQIKKLVLPEYQGLVLALSLGDRSQLTSPQRTLFQQTGTSHLIAISGLHLGLVASMVYWLVRLGWSCCNTLTRIIPAPRAAIVFAFVSALVYALLAGFSLPTQRALIMIAVVLGSVMLARPVAVSHSLCLAALLVLLLDPLSFQSSGFWLSFCAVAAILYLLQGRTASAGSLRRWFKLQVALSLLLGPLLIICFNQLPVYSVAANVVSIPLVGLVIVPLLLLAMPGLFLEPAFSEVLYRVVVYLIDMLWWFLEWLQSLPVHTLAVPGSGFSAWLCAFIGILILFMPRGLPARWLGIVWLLPLAFPQLLQPKPSEFRLTLLDVGQGLAALVQTRKHTLLYDTGARFSERFDVGEAVIVPYLVNQGIQQLDMLVISHGDNDHIGGASAVIEAAQPARVLSSVPAETGYQHAFHCHAGQGWEWDGVRFDMLHPASDGILEGNNASCVLKVSGAYGSVLLTGDIERRAEADLVQHHYEKLGSRVLVVPHHGSRSSSSPAFINAVGPDYALITAGYRNRFGLPKQDIIMRYKQRGVDTRVSYQSGALLVNFASSGLTVDDYRHEYRRFWHNDAYHN